MLAEMGSFYDWEAQRLWTKPEILAAVDMRRGTLKSMGVVDGSRVLLQASSGIEFFISVFALWSLRACAVPIDPRLTESERTALQKKSGANIALPAKIEDICKPLPIGTWPAVDSREALILFTTGTLSSPRGVILSAHAVQNKISAVSRALPLPDMQSTLCFLPVSFGHGLIANSLGPWLNGCALTSAPPLDPAGAQGLPELLAARAITSFSSVPGAWALLDRMIGPQTETTVRRIFCASAPLGENTFRIIGDLFPGVPVHNVYGLTEMASWVSMSGAITKYKSGDIGKPFDGEIKIDGGEIYVRGASRMTGYLGENALGGGEWFKTEDLAEAGADGGLILKGRAGHIVNKGGVKVQLEEIDSLLASNSQVREALCFKTEDHDVGVNFEVAVVLASDSSRARAELQKWFAETVNHQRRPAKWHFLDALPANERGKPDRAGVKRLLRR